MVRWSLVGPSWWVSGWSGRGGPQEGRDRINNQCSARVKRVGKSWAEIRARSKPWTSLSSAIISASVALHRPTFLPHRHPSPLLLSAEPQDFSKLVADSEAFLEDMGIGEDAASTEAALRLNQPLKPPRRKRRKKAAELPPRPVKASKANKFRIGCYGCGADLQTTNPAAAGYVEPERYELKAVHRQLKLLLCRRCRALTHGEILPAVAEGRLRPVVPAAAATSVEDAAIPLLVLVMMPTIRPEWA